MEHSNDMHMTRDKQRIHPNPHTNSNPNPNPNPNPDGRRRLNFPITTPESTC